MIFMGVSVNREKCCYCGACVAVCPKNCIELDEVRIEIDNSKCIDCLACIRMCPVGALGKIEKK